MRVAGLLLAAGAGRRFGSPKALVPLHGKLFVDSAAELLRTAGCAPVVVVLGAQADEVRAKLAAWHALGLDEPLISMPPGTPDQAAPVLAALIR